MCGERPWAALRDRGRGRGKGRGWGRPSLRGGARISSQVTLQGPSVPGSLPAYQESCPLQFEERGGEFGTKSLVVGAFRDLSGQPPCLPAAVKPSASSCPPAIRPNPVSCKPTCLLGRRTAF